MLIDVDPSAVVTRRLTDTRRRALAQDRGELGPVETIHVGAPHEQQDTVTPPLDAVPRRPRADAARARARALRLRAQERLQGDRRRRVGRDRLGARRGARGRGARQPSACTASRCRRATRPRGRAATRSGSPRISAATSARSRSSRSSSEFIGALAPSFADVAPDLTEENLQARARGVLLMALSNKFGWLLVATGNKSEMSVGYATLYGDMAGGFALLKDVYKTDVFRLARHLNERAGRELIPQSMIDRAPSAELRDDQLDEDSLPPYPQLDRVLEAYVEDDRTLEELSSRRLRPGRRRARGRARRPRRVQAPPGTARRAAAAEGVRPRPADADHEPLAQLNDCDLRGRDQVAVSQALRQILRPRRHTVELVDREPALLVRALRRAGRAAARSRTPARARGTRGAPSRRGRAPRG